MEERYLDHELYAEEDEPTVDEMMEYIDNNHLPEFLGFIAEKYEEIPELFLRKMKLYREFCENWRG